MCGISGVWHLDASRQVNPTLIRAMTDTLRHRGPDDEGYLFANTATGALMQAGGEKTSPALALPDLHRLDAESGYNLTFGFRRLAILDLSPAGHQPMGTADDGHWIVFNGEIYNYRDLRSELQAKGYTFRTGTDTEVLLTAYAEWGERSLDRLNGMWAFAIWHSRQRKLFCARDRFGIKPFYYWWDGATLAFASEIKALLHLPGLVRRPNNGLIYDYLRYGRTDHTSETFFQQIRQLEPGHCLTLQDDGDLRIRPYYALDLKRPIAGGDDAQHAARFSALFEDAIRLHLRSDVSVGSCLSGGLDSSAIVCVTNRLLQDRSEGTTSAIGDRQKTFSSCYDDSRYDERPYIEAVLKQTGAEANYTFPSSEGLLQSLPQLLWHQDEPFAGLSIYAQWCVMQTAAQRRVKVLLDGQGGDELLAGYPACFDYYWGGLLRRGQFAALGNELSAYRTYYGVALPKLALRALRPFAPTTLQGMVRRWQRGSHGIAADFAHSYRERDYEFVERSSDPLRGFLAQLLRYSIPMLLRFEDRNSMAHSIEARVPFLDHRLVEYAFGLPPEQKIHQATTKVILRNALKGTLPEVVRQRRDKMGFVAPEREWLAHDLCAWVDDLVSSRSFCARAYFDPQQIRDALADHRAGRRDLTKLAWRWFNLELWLRQMIDGAG